MTNPGLHDGLLSRARITFTLGIVSVITLVGFEAWATATAMPAMARDLDALSGYTWAFNAYIVASLLAMVIAGLRCDERGPRGSLISGVFALAAGSLVAGFATNYLVFVLGRALQGVGGGAIIVAVYVLIARAYPESLRPKAFLLLSTSWIVPSLVGPLVAGWLTDTISWRIVFWLVPFFVIPPLLLMIPKMGALQGGEPSSEFARRVGAGIVATIGLIAIQDGLSRANAVGLVEAGAGFVLLIFSGKYLVPIGALRMARGLPATVMMRGIIAAAYFSAEVFVPLALVETRGVSYTIAGLTIAVSAVFWAAGSFAQSRLSGDADRAPIVCLGSLVTAACLLTLPLVVLTSLPVWIASISWALGAFGMGLAIPSVSVQTMRLSPESDQGINAAALQIVDSVLVVAVTAILGLFYAAAVAGQGATPQTYALLWVISAIVALVGAFLAPRMRPITI
ncbi:MAG: MFS transporter [Candidatus Nanopelagicales bacterium]|nr:MFS transporter [Candidatus Nanopelagicales bacterium]